MRHRGAASVSPLLIATANAGKVREFEYLLAGLGLELRSLGQLSGVPGVAEDRPTYAENAMLKALTIARWSGQVALADDSGLEVDALGGAPGVHSARYGSGQQDAQLNIATLLRALAGIEPSARTARFRCVLVVAAPDGTTLSAAGTVEGTILDAPRGAGGFGYDPVFFHAPSGCTFAELSPREKDRISHRAMACAQLRLGLPAFLVAHAGSRA